MVFLGGSGDPALDIALSARNAVIFEAFGKFLVKVASRNPDVKAVLLGKANESLATAKKFRSGCRAIVRSTNPMDPSRYGCEQKGIPTFIQLVKWSDLEDGESEDDDLDSDEVKELERKIFANPKSSDPVVELAKLFYDEEYYHHTMASGLYGISSHPSARGSLSAIIGCTALKLGLYAEAKYHLKKATDYQGMRRRCLDKLISVQENL